MKEENGEENNNESKEAVKRIKEEEQIERKKGSTEAEY